MQLDSRRHLPEHTDVASALREAAGMLAHRPAMTVLAATGRQEQSFTSVAQWTAKCAHWLTIEHQLGPGAAVGIAGPPGWVPAVAALGAWWAGCQVVVEDLDGAEVVVAHADHVPDVTAEVVTWGWAFDGTPEASPPQEPFAHAVQPFPDQPPPTLAGPDVRALVDAERSWAQRDLLALWRGADAVPAGVTADVRPERWLPAVALRPLVTGRPSVVLAPGVDRAAAEGDRVGAWL